MNDSRVDHRRRIADEHLDLTRGPGLEIGPLAAPIALRGSSTVSYVDVVDRDGLLAHYANDPNVDHDAVPDIDYWLTREDGTTATLAEAVIDGAPFAWVIASHVVEHVPDVVGWLREIGDILADDGGAFLVIPDRRFCFDARRAPTTVGMALQAHELGDRIPSIRAVYDHFRTAVDMHTDRAWRGEVVGPERTIHPFTDVVDRIARVRTGEYIDAHVWTFSPASFIDLVEDLGRLGLVDLTIREIVPTAEDEPEFYVVLRRIPRGTAPATADATRQHDVESARARIPSELLSHAHQVLVLEHRRTEEQLARLQGELATARERLARTRGQRDRARRRLRRARRMLEAQRRSAVSSRLPHRLSRLFRGRVRRASSHDKVG